MTAWVLVQVVKDSPSFVHHLQRKGALWRPWSEPHKQLGRSCIDYFHQANLFTFFTDVRLVDT